MSRLILPVCVIAVLWYLAPVSDGLGAGWIDFNDETPTRLLALPGLGSADPDEKDYAWGDVDQDGDIDLVCVRKQPFTTPGRRPNVLFMNEGIAEGHAIDGVLVDRTALYASAADDGGLGFRDATNDRDVILVDVNNDTWLDIITVATLGDGLPKTISHPRVYINLGDVPPGSGNWQGFRYEEARIPQLRTIPGGVAVAPRLCSIAAGDVTGDGFVDLYIGDYDSSGVGGGFPEDPADDVNDRLLVNDGTGHFVDSLQNRMNAEMLLSAFNMAVAIEDMNGDGVLDVVKDTALNFPQRVSIAYNDPANEGFFDQLDVVDQNSPYHITVGDLNNDGLLDIVVTDDGQDRYWLNQGNGLDGLADFISFNFIRSGGADGEFGGNSVIADLNNDGFNDVIIADVDVDIDQACSRRLHIYRNLGNLPQVTLQEQGGAQPWTPNGTHDIAVFDLNGDGWLDMVVGHCTGTDVWINVPPTDLVFAYPDGLPGQLIPDTPITFRVSVSGVLDLPQPGTGKQYVAVDAGSFVETAMTEESPNVYFAQLPAVACTSTARFYFTVETDQGVVVRDPDDAPTVSYSALSSAGTTTVLDDRFETDTGWTVTNDLSLSTGAWVRVDPLGTFFPEGSGNPAQPENDFGAAAEETHCYITEQYSGSGPASASDVDGGPTVLTSPVFDLAGTDAQVTYARWLFCNDQGTADEDFLAAEINNGAGWVPVHQTNGTGGVWESASFKVSDFVTPTSTVQIRFVVADSPNNSVTEAGIDNFNLSQFICPIPCNSDPDCDDSLFCNGVETCVADFCEMGTDPCPGQACDEGSDACVECVADADCDNGQFCDGAETCVANTCLPATDPCAGAGQTCDEVNDVCVGCLLDPDCDDNLYCNGQETCIDNTCYAESTGVINGTFDDSAWWSDNIPVDGSISYGGSLTVVGPNNGSGGFTWAAQAGVDLAGADLEFDLLSYTTGDTGDWDRPVFYVDGTYYGLDADGTLGSVASQSQGNFGTIDNGNQVTSPIHFVVDLEALVGPGPHEIGFGVMSVDGVVAPGTARYDDVLPVPGPVDVCPGQACDEGTDTCVDCLEAGDCQDTLFCNGVEQCVGQTCAGGADPCPGQFCDEGADLCHDCNDNLDCDDGLFCNGTETCQGGFCLAGVGPCPGQLCDETNDTCLVALQPRMGQPVLGLTSGEMARFQVGKARFDEVLTEPNGLGPIFNQNSCAACHNTAGIGGSGSILVTRFGFVDKGGFVGLEEFGGSLLQLSAISPECQEFIPVEANIVANRITPSIFGGGLVETITDADILANETSPPPGISGRVHMVEAFENPGVPRAGRFGWKAQVPTILTFSADAALNEMGLTNRFLLTENDPNGIRPPELGDPDFCDTVPDPEDGPEGGVPGNPHFIDRVTDFQRFLAPPPQTPRSGMTGQTIFENIGCADCHQPTFITGVAPEAVLSNQIITPYSDFLLHDMGGLGDGIEQGGAGVTEMRTALLWGLRVRDAMLHDGRVAGGTFASRIAQVINWHGSTGSEAAAAATAFAVLSSGERDALVAFLDSLGRAEFDQDGDGDIDLVDADAFFNCLTGPDAGAYTGDDSCAISDVDQDADVDLYDNSLLQRAFTGPL